MSNGLKGFVVSLGDRLTMIKRQFKQWQRKGRWPIVVRLAGRLYHFPRHCRERLRYRRVIRRLAVTLAERDPDCLVSLVTSDFEGVFKPLQVEHEFRMMMHRVASVCPRRIVEIGTANGATLFAMTRVAADDAVVVSVDLPGGTFGGGYPAWKTKLYGAFARPGQNLHLLRQDSHCPQTYECVRGLVGEGTVDVLFIDGDHTYDGVKKDYFEYKPLVRRGGLIFFHDVIENKWDASVQVDRFWREVKASGQLGNCQEYVDDYSQGKAGIGVGELIG
jgi:predicted O-methyltransferase YrrM